MTQDRRITDKLPGRPLQWEEAGASAPAAGQAGLAKLVPEIPTASMIEAAHAAEHCGHGDAHFVNAYRAMIGAAPVAASSRDMLIAEAVRNECLSAAHDADPKHEIRRIDLAAIVSKVSAPVAADTEQATGELRNAVREMAAALEAREWAEHVSSDPDAAALESQITELVGLHTASHKLISEAISLATPADAGGDEKLEFELNLLAEDCQRMLDALPAADAGAGLTDEEIMQPWHELDGEAWDKGYDRPDPKEFARRIEKLVLARLSTSSAPVPSSDPDSDYFTPKQVQAIVASINPGDGWSGEDWDFALVNAAARKIGQSPAPVTAEPVAWYDPTNKMSVTFSADKREKWPHLYPVALFTTTAPADRDAIRDQALSDAENIARCYDLGTPGGHAIANLIAALKSMVRAADAAETRDAEGGV